MRCEWLQFREELQQILRRLCQDPWEHGAAGAGAHSAHPLVYAIPARRPTLRAYHLRKDVSSYAHWSGPVIISVFHPQSLIYQWLGK